MESNQNENVILIDRENEICLDESNTEDEIMNKFFQIVQNTTKRSIEGNEKKFKQTFKNNMFKEKCEKA
jgi:hypothetical protein